MFATSRERSAIVITSTSGAFPRGECGQRSASVLFGNSSLLYSAERHAEKRMQLDASQSRWELGRRVADSCLLRRFFSSRSSRSLRSEEHTSELQSHSDLVCRLLL